MQQYSRKSGNWGGKKAAVHQQLADVRAVEPLIAALRDQDNRDQIAAYMVACIGSGELMPAAPGLMGTAVDIRDSKFTIDNQNILLSGQFTDTVTINGTIEAKSAEASKCGIPASDKWTAKCGVPTELVTLMIGGKSFSAEPGPCK